VIRPAASVAADTGASLRAAGFVPGPGSELGAAVARLARSEDPAGAVSGVEDAADRAFVAQAVRVFRPLRGFRGGDLPWRDASPTAGLGRSLSSPFAPRASSGGSDSLGLPIERRGSGLSDGVPSAPAPARAAPTSVFTPTAAALLLGIVLGVLLHAMAVAP